MFGTRISLQSLATLCRSLSTMLESGVAIVKALQTSAARNPSPRLQRALVEIVDQIKSGDELSVAMVRQGRYFPDLVIDMVAVGESSGSLPEVLRGLAEHYENLIRLRRSFLTAITWPCLQLGAAIFVLTALIYLLGLIAETRGGEPLDVLGFGLTGTTGALVFFCGSWGAIAAVVGGYFLLVHGLGQQRSIHSLLLRVPVAGSCMRSFAVARFSWAFYLTQQTGMSILKSLESSLRATGNGAFAGASDLICARIKEGEELSSTLAESGLFPPEFLEMVSVAEASGTVPEMLHRLSPQFEDQARRSLAALAAAFGWLVWMVVAGLMIFVIFRVFMSVYINPINSILKDM